MRRRRAHRPITGNAAALLIPSIRNTRATAATWAIAIIVNIVATPVPTIDTGIIARRATVIIMAGTMVTATIAHTTRPRRIITIAKT